MNNRTIPILTVLLTAIMLFSCACRGRGGRADGSQAQAAPKTKAKAYGYRVKQSYPHDREAFTQGLYWHDGHLWEGTGSYGGSSLRKVELESGRILEKRDLDPQRFGEGIAMINNKIYQLTWHNEVALVYDAQTLEKTGQFAYKGEGWGLTTDGSLLYMSNGSSRIYVIDPADFSRKRSINVQANGRNVTMLNELEWIDGRIWANVFLSDTVVVIDPATGEVTGTIDFGGLLADEHRRPDTDVMNGIAYDRQTGRIFVTGKNWPLLFEIEITEK